VYAHSAKDPIWLRTMRLNLLNYAGGLGLVAGALLWPSASQAQGFCYMVDSAGRVINLDGLCESGGASARVQPQIQPQGQFPGAEGALIEPQQSSSPEVRSFTLTGPPSVPGSSQTPAGTAPATAGTTPATTGTTTTPAGRPITPAGTTTTPAGTTTTPAGRPITPAGTTAPAGATTTTPAGTTAPAGTTVPGRQTVVPGIQVPRIEVPQTPVPQPPVIQSPVPQTSDTVDNVTDTPNR